jgi:integrase
VAIHRLDDLSRSVRELKTAGTFADGKGLYLRVRAAGQGSYTVKFGTREQSLGPADLITLDDARDLHRRMRLEAHAGRDPWALLTTKAIVAGHAVVARALPEMAQASDLPAGVTRQRFADVVESFLLHSPAVAAWKADSKEPRKYRHLKTGTLGKLWADEITAADIGTELKSRWGHALASADKYRMRIKLVCDYARAMGFRDKDAVNPANNDDIKNLIAKPPKGVPHPSLPVAECPAFFAELSADTSDEARALGFAILTAARTQEARDIDWSEIKGNVWTVPADRMKEGAVNGDHFVPLSDAALALLGMPKNAGRVFGQLPHDALDDKLKEYRDMGVATVHGFRTSFNGWAVKAGYPESLWGRALHHAVGNKTGRAYNREPMIEERRPMMVAWSDFITTEKAQ